MRGRAPTKNGAVTGLQSSAATRRPESVPTAEQLPPLLERSPLAIFDEAITFLRIRPATMFGIAFIVLLPLRLIAGLLPGSSLRDARPDQLIDILIGNLSAPGAVTAAFATLLSESLALFAVGAIYGKLLANWYSGRAPLASDVLVWSIKRSPILFLLWFVTHALEFVGGMLSGGIGGVALAIFFLVVAPVVGAEDATFRTAIRRSMSLVTPRFFAGIVFFILVGAGGQAMRLVLRLLPTILGINVLPIPSWIVGGVFDLLATTVMIAFTASAATILYLDLRIRLEGIDLDMAMARAFPGARVRQREGS